MICRDHFPRPYSVETINNTHVDFAFTEKGFNSIGNLIDAIKDNGDLNNIPGIIYRDTNSWIKTADEPLIDLNNLPFPAR